MAGQRLGRQPVVAIDRAEQWRRGDRWFGLFSCADPGYLYHHLIECLNLHRPHRL